MKQLYSLFLASVCLLVSHISRAQLCQDNINTVTTQWNSPASNNTWDWTAQFFTDAYIKNRPQPTTIASPFYSPNSTLQNQNIIFLQNAAVKDCQPIDGWELLIKDLGSGAALPATAVSNPFFALYNRYSSTIRVFFLVTDPITATNNGATVSLQFEKTGQRASALLAHAESIMPAVDRFSKDISMRVPNRYTNEADFWMFADFPVAYDPCTCMFSSRLRFTFELIQSTDANLSIKLNGTGYLKQVIKSNAGVNVNGSDFPVFNWVNGLISSGTKGYNTYSTFASGAAAINAFNNTLNPGTASNELDTFKNIMQLGNTIPYLGGMMGVFDFLLAGGRTASKTAAPMAFEANLKFDLSGSATGKLDLSIPRGDRILKTPGSLNDGTAAIPKYNNVLGLIALLETPKIEYVVYTNARTNGTLGAEYLNPSYDPNCDLGYDEYGYPQCPPETIYTSIGVYDDQIKQYRLVDDLKYAVNPAAGLQLTDLKAALVVDNPTSGLGTYAATFGDPTLLNGTVPDFYNRIGYEKETDKRFRTPFLPLGCLGSTSIAVAQNRNRTFDYVDPKIYLKVKAIFTRVNAPANTQPIIYLATYRVDVSRDTNDPGNLQFDQVYVQDCPDPYNSLSYGDRYYYRVKGGFNMPYYPLTQAGIAGASNPAYPSNCSRQVAAQTSPQIQQFCTNTNKYNPVVLARPGKNARPSSSTASIQLTCVPNPASAVSRIFYTLNQESQVSIELIDNMGRNVQRIIDRELQSVGEHEVKFSALNLPAGLYHCVLQTADQRKSIKVVISK